MGDFFADPRRQFQALVDRLQFHFGDDQSLGWPVENIDLPNLAGKCHAITRLLDQDAGAKSSEHLLRVVDRDLILELMPDETRSRTFHREPRPILGDPNANAPVTVVGNISLPQLPTPIS